jgi:hypothetical protein
MYYEHAGRPGLYLEISPVSVAPMNRCQHVDPFGARGQCVRQSCHMGHCDYEPLPEPPVGDMSIPNKVLAHVTRVEFGEVSARLMMGGAWAIFDRRGVRQGAHMVDEGLSFHDAVIGAYRVSTSPEPKR